MLRKLVRYQKFWEKNGAKYCYQVDGIKIAILPPEDYKHVRCVSTPTKNRERKWGFKTQEDLNMFIMTYNIAKYMKEIRKNAKENY